jgi:DNA-binding transcriptional LysR family regulator
MDRIEALRTFVAVTSEGSFTKAADRLGISTQLVSKYVSQLEAHLGARLLHRTTRKVSVTEAGAHCVLQAQQILSDMSDLENQLGTLQDTVTGVLRISAPVSFSIHHLAPALVAFQQRYPEVQVDLQLSDQKIDLVENGFDIALRIGQLASSSLVAKRLADIRLVRCAAPSYLAKHGTPKTLEALTKHHYLHYSYASDAFFEGSPSIGLVKRPMVSNNGDVLVKAAIGGAGIVLQPTFIVGEAIANGQLQVILKDDEPELMGLYAVYANRQWLSNKVRRFLDFMDGYFGSPPYWDEFES